MTNYKPGDILIDTEFGLTIALIERFVREKNVRNKPDYAWKALVTANEKEYDDSKVGSVVVVGENFLDEWYDPI